MTYHDENTKTLLKAKASIMDVEKDRDLTTVQSKEILWRSKVLTTKPGR